METMEAIHKEPLTGEKGETMTRTMTTMACPLCGEETEVDISDFVMVAGADYFVFCTICATLWRVTLAFYEVEADEEE